MITIALTVALTTVQQPRPRPAPPAPAPRIATIRRRYGSEETGGMPELMIMNEDGTRSRRIEVQLPHGRPAWSPNGRRLAFVAELDLSYLEVFVLEHDGSFAKLTSSGPNSAVDPAWSPDGSRIVFAEWQGERADLWVIDANGGVEPVRLTSDAANETRPAWSHDGSTIAFVSNRTGSPRIYLMNADGSNVRRLTSGAAPEDDPAWSPDGARIAFASGGDIAVIAVAGGAPVPLTRDPATDGAPSWSPDGTRLAFHRSVAEDSGAVYVINADGSNARRITPSDSYGAAAWGAPPLATPDPPRAVLAGTLVPPRRPLGGPVPVVVFLPPTFQAAEWIAAQYFSDRPDDYAAILLAGTGSANDYVSGANWSNTIARYERQLFADLARFAGSANLDTTRVILAGFSMGGDLAWALALRNPSKVAGAIVMGSRASYRSRAADHQALAANQRRFFFTLGADEDPARVSGARAATALLTQLGVTYQQRESGSGHAPATPETFAEALRFVLGGSR